MAIVAKPRAEITEEDIAFLRENYTSTGGLLPNAYAGGAFYTPTHVARFVIEALRGLSGGSFAPGSRFLEPSAGSGVFIEHLPQDGEVTALELDETSAKVTSLIYPHANVITGDAFRHARRDYYDYVIGNPPYGVNLDIDAAEIPDSFDTLRITKGRAKGKSEVAFIELAIKAVKPGGYIAFVLPKGIGHSSAAKKIRDIMRETCWHITSIELPGTTFAMTGTTIPTDIHVLRKITPNANKVHVKYSVKGSSRAPLTCVTQKMDTAEADTFWYTGQPPIFQASITDIGYDKDGKSTDKWGDGLTQLDELLEAFTDDNLMRENTDPIGPFDGVEKEGDEFHGFNVKISPFEEWRAKRGYMAYWNVLTLGRGGDIVTPSSVESSFDFEWQDRIVADYYAESALGEAA